jgi:hypothetical protein
MKPLVYLMNVLGLAPFVLEEGRGCREFRVSTFMSVYSVVVLVIVLFGELVAMIWQGFAEGMDNVYAFAFMIKSSAYMISYSGFLFFTLLFRRKIVNFLHMLLSFNSSIHNIFQSYGTNFNLVMAQVFVVVSVYALIFILIVMRFEKIHFTKIVPTLTMSVSVISVNLVPVLFINLAVLLKQCFTRINTCLCKEIQCAGEGLVGRYRHISALKHPHHLIPVNYKSDRPRSRLEHIRRSCDFLCDFVDLFNSVYSAHTLVLVTFYVFIFIYDSYFGFVGMMDVNKGLFTGVMWVRVTLTETAINAAGFMVLLYFCSSTTCEVRLCTYFVLIPGQSRLSDLNGTE